MKKLIVSLFLFLFLNNISAKNWFIGPSQTYKYCSDVATLVGDNDTVSIAAALYDNDKQVSWKANNLYIHGIGGKPILRAGDQIANDASNGKGIFVIEGKNTTVENIEFQNAKVIDHNGAGIRQAGANLVVRYCIFSGNEMGILAGDIANSTILMEFNEFFNNGSVANPGYQHNIYINHIDTFIFRYNFSHDAIAEGHELKSRAGNNFIYYNRISNLSSNDSRNIDMPNGGTAVIVGNIIEQTQASANSNIIAFGMEGLINPAPHNLYLAHNTIVNKKITGSFVQVNGIDTLFLANNIFCGAQTGGFILGAYQTIDSSNNLVFSNWNNPIFKNAILADYHLTSAAGAIDKGKQLTKKVANYGLEALFEYADTAKFMARFVDNKPDIGALEYVKPAGIQKSDRLPISIYPNPIKDKLTIAKSTNKLAIVRVYNSIGMRVFNEVVSQKETTLDLSILQSGVYILELHEQNQLFTQRFIKE